MATNLKQKVEVRLDCLLYGLFVYFNAREEKVNEFQFEGSFKGFYGLQLTDYITLDEIKFMLKERDLYK